MLPEESKKSLGLIFKKIDTDKNEILSKDELSAWISKISRQMIVGDVDNIWSEYGLGNSDTLTWNKHIDHIFGDDGEFEDEDTVSRNSIVIKEERRWKAADKNGDGQLSKEEFISFTHPEHDTSMREIIVLEALDEVDKNGDGFIDIDEYISDLWKPDSPNEAEPDWLKTEREQFSLRRDKNGDGKLDKDEVGHWIVPNDFDHVQSEVNHLFAESDTDKDGKLSVDEVLEHYDLFVSSHATNFGEIIGRHDEL